MKLLALVGALAIASPSFAQVQYPPTRTVDVSDTYFGMTYKDPYRWLEDLKDQDVEALVQVAGRPDRRPAREDPGARRTGRGVAGARQA